jgi:transcriptional regulator with XRE-family HTH domain
MEPLRGAKGMPLSDRQVQGLRQIGAQLRRARIGNGWTQRYLEYVSGVDQTTISRLENGRLVSLRLVRIGDLMQALSGTWQLFSDQRAGGTSSTPATEADATNGINEQDSPYLVWLRGERDRKPP